MSTVTNVLLTFSVMEESNKIILVNKFLVESRMGCFGKEIGGSENYCGGNKFMETNVYAAAFDNFNEKEFIEHLKSIDWQCPQDVQIFIQRQDEDIFTIYTLQENTK